MTELEDFLAAQKANALTVEEQQSERLNSITGVKAQKRNHSDAKLTNRKENPSKKHKDFQGTGFFGSYTRRNKHLGIPKKNAPQSA